MCHLREDEDLAKVLEVQLLVDALRSPLLLCGVH